MFLSMTLLKFYKSIIYLELFLLFCFYKNVLIIRTAHCTAKLYLPENYDKMQSNYVDLLCHYKFNIDIICVRQIIVFGTHTHTRTQQQQQKKQFNEFTLYLMYC